MRPRANDLRWALLLLCCSTIALTGIHPGAPTASAQADPEQFPAYIQLQRPVVINADLWSDELEIMAANYGFEGIIGIPGLLTPDDLDLAIEAGAGVNLDWADLDPVPPLRNLTSGAGPLGVASVGFGALPVNADAMPIEVSWPLLPGTVSPDNIAITLNTGEIVTPVAAALNPNFDHNERHVVVVFGTFGNRLEPGTPGAVYPVSVSFVDGDSPMMAIGTDGPVSVTGLSRSSTNPYVAGPALIGAKLNHFSPVGDFPPPALSGSFPNDGYSLYGEDAQYRLRLFTSGGFSPDGVSGYLPTDFPNTFRLHAVDADGEPVLITQTGVSYDLGVGTVEVVGLAEVGPPLDSPIVPGQPDRAYYVEDHDNYFDIILKGDEEAIRLLRWVEIPTSEEPGYDDIYNPGGPGRTPVDGTIYTKPAQRQLFAVDISLDDHRTVSYAAQDLVSYDQDDDLPVVFRLRDASGSERLTASSILATDLVDAGQSLAGVPFANETARPGVGEVRAYLELATGNRIYTLDPAEQAALEADPAWQDEGRVFGAFDRLWPGSGAFYRMYDLEAGRHLFDADLNILFQDSGIAYQGIGWYAAQFLPQPAELHYTRSDSLLLDDPIHADSKLIKEGAGTLDLAAGGSFAAGIEVNEGRLQVGGLLSGGPLTVGPDATLSGIGIIANTSLIQGRLAPGQSPGTVTFLAPVTMSSGSTLEIEIDGPLPGWGPGSYDRVAVLGVGNSFTAAGTLEVHLRGITTPANNDFTPALGQSFAGIVTAQGGVSGSFEQLLQPAEGLAPGTRMDIVYGNQAIDLVVTPAHYGDLAAAGLTQNVNQQAVGVALDTFRPAAGQRPAGSADSLFPALAALPAGQIGAGLDSLSGEIHASARTALIEDSIFVRSAVTDRVRTAFAGVAAPVMPVMTYSPDSPMGAQQDAWMAGPATTHRMAAWGQAFGSWGRTSGDGNAARLDRDIGGFLAGIDAAVMEMWRIGLVAGYARASFDVDDRASSGNSDNYHLGLYGGTQWGAFGLRLGGAHSWHSIDTSRSIALPGLADSVEASYRARTTQLFGEAGYQIDFGNVRIEPFTGLAHVHLRTPGFSESGGPAALIGQGETTSTTFTTLGVRTDTGFVLGGVRATVRGTLGWRHAFGDTHLRSTHAFAAGDAFTITGVPVARDAAVIEAGIDLDLSDQAILSVSYEGQFGSGAQQNGLNGRLTVSF